MAAPIDQPKSKYFFGHKVSLISNSDIRYEGTLYALDEKALTISLSDVRSFGTESRRPKNVILPRDDIYEYIVFRGTDVKDIIVCENPETGRLLDIGDPAVLDVKKKSESVSTFPLGMHKSSASSRFDGVGHSQPMWVKSASALHNVQPVGVHERGIYNRSFPDFSRCPNDQSFSSENCSESGANFPSGLRRGFVSGRGQNSSVRGGFNNFQPAFRNNRSYGAEQDLIDEKKPNFDFEVSNKQFLELNRSKAWKIPLQTPEDGGDADKKTFYDKENFYDAISCEVSGKPHSSRDRRTYQPAAADKSTAYQAGERLAVTLPANESQPDFDFMKSTQQFLAASVAEEFGETVKDNGSKFYNPNSFYDLISCESMEKEQNAIKPQSRNKPRTTNDDTFGLSNNRGSSEGLGRPYGRVSNEHDRYPQDWSYQSRGGGRGFEGGRDNMRSNYQPQRQYAQNWRTSTVQSAFQDSY